MSVNIPQFIVGKQTTDLNATEQEFVAEYRATDPIITEHRIYDIAVVPGSLHIARLAYVVSNVYLQPTFTITEINFIKPLAIKEDAVKHVHLIIAKENSRQYAFKVLSFNAKHTKDAKPDLHAIGHFTLDNTVAYPDQNRAANLVLIDQLKQRCTEELSMHRFYAYFSSIGLKYGAGYKWLEHMYFAGNEALNYMRAAHTAEELQWNVLQPGQIDCSFQGLISLMFDKMENNPIKDAWVLGAIKQVKLFAQPKGSIICHNVMYDVEKITSESRKAVCDITCYDDQGNLIALFEGVLVARAAKEKIMALLGS